MRVEGTNYSKYVSISYPATGVMPNYDTYGDLDSFSRFKHTFYVSIPEVGEGSNLGAAQAT